MVLIRRTEETIADLVESGEARGPCHLSIGQEAVAAGVCAGSNPAIPSGAGIARTGTTWPKAARSRGCLPRFWEKPRDARAGAEGRCT